MSKPKRNRKPRPPKRLRHAHVSGKWSVAATVLAAYLALIVRVIKPHVITCTESQGMASAVRKRIGRRYEVAQEGEFLLATRRDKTDLGGTSLRTLSDQFGGSSEWRDSKAMFAWVRVPGFGRILFVLVHLSSAVQHGSGWSGFGAGVRSHQEATGRLAAVVEAREVKAERSGDGAEVVVVGDVNLDLKLPRWRRYLARLGNAAWTGKRATQGTHGSRLIDGAWSTMPVRRARVLGLKRPAAFDHRTFVTAYDLRPRFRAEPSKRAA